MNLETNFRKILSSTRLAIAQRRKEKLQREIANIRAQPFNSQLDDNGNLIQTGASEITGSGGGTASDGAEGHQSKIKGLKTLVIFSLRVFSRKCFFF